MALGTELVITNPAGAVVSTEPAQLVDVSVTQPLSGDLPAGLYTVQWRVTSEDAHPIEGTFTFTAVAAATPASGAETPSVAEPAPSTSETSVAPPSPVPATSSDLAASDEQGTGGAISAGLLLAIAGGLLLVGVVIALLLWRRSPPAPPAD
ncbi:hypothetical protein ASD18_12215 [Cellulomonas sp. Root137]|nr:hypothetical protein ASD18_12215 [Cellulomonas sp. Root137]